jgi:hypothetical protein
MIDKINVKKLINSSLESTGRIKSLLNNFSSTKKPILILGDGISSIYAHDMIHDYEYIIISNRSIMNQELKNFSPLFWVIMEPHLLTKLVKKNLEFWEMIRKNFLNYEKTIPVMHPLGRLVNFGKWKNLKPLYFSPYHKLKLNSQDTYDFFGGAFQACLGMALLSGFTNIHCAGFDTWLLSPQNNLRWYSRCSNPESFDFVNFDDPPEFLKVASRNSKISVYSYRHYKPKYGFLSEIQLKAKNIYLPERDRSKYMLENDLKIWEEFENFKYPHGLEAIKK